MKNILTFTIVIFSLIINTSLAVSSQVDESTNNSVKTTESTQLPQELLAKFNNELTNLKAKAESQKTPKKTARMMRFYWQYKNAFDAMPTKSKIDVLNIFATGDDQSSKLKGFQLIDKAVEYMVLIDGGFTNENVDKLKKYHHFFKKFNPSTDKVLNNIILFRVEKLRSENKAKEKMVVAKEKMVVAKEKMVADKTKLLEELIVLRKQMEIFAK